MTEIKQERIYIQQVFLEHRRMLTENVICAIPLNPHNAKHLLLGLHTEQRSCRVQEHAEVLCASLVMPRKTNLRCFQCQVPQPQQHTSMLPLPSPS